MIPPTLNERIRALSDPEAVALVRTLGTARATAMTPPTFGPELAAALREAFGIEGEPPPASEGDLARESLLLFAEDEAAAAAIAHHFSGARNRFALGGAELALGAAVAVLLLGTHIRYERETKDGGTTRTKLIIDKPAQASLLKPVMAKLLSLWQ